MGPGVSGRKLALGLAVTSLLALGGLPACGGSASSGGPDGAATRAEVAVDNLEVTTPSLSAQVCAHLRSSAATRRTPTSRRATA